MAAEAELEREGFYDEDEQMFREKEQQELLQQQTSGDLDKAAQEAAKAAGEAAKNLLGGVTSLGGSLLSKAAGISKQPQIQPKLSSNKSAKSAVAAEPKVGSDSDEAKGEKHVTFGLGVDDEDQSYERIDHRPKFVKHINKTRTMSGKQKWEWAFDKIIQVGCDQLSQHGMKQTQLTYQPTASISTHTLWLVFCPKLILISCFAY